MTISLKADAGGTFGALQFGGADIVRLDGNKLYPAPGKVIEANAGPSGSPLAGMRNKIINGNFDIWQRGTSQTFSGYGSVDRWVNTHTGSTKICSRQAFALGQTDVSNEPTYFFRTVVTSVAGASNTVNSAQRIESVRTLAGQTATLTFWAKADASKNIAVEFVQVFGSGGSPSAGVPSIGVATCALTTAWQKFTVTVTLPSIAGKTLGTGNNDYLAVIFWFDAGSDFNARTNSLGQQSGTFDIAQVQLEQGNVATPFEQRFIGLEFMLCQRYYEIGRVYIRGLFAAGASTIATTVRFSSAKRATPTIVFPNPGYINASNVTSSDQGQDGYGGFTALASVTTGGIDTIINSDWTADAEL